MFRLTVAIFSLGLLFSGCYRKSNISAAEGSAKQDANKTSPATSPSNEIHLPEGELAPDDILSYINSGQLSGKAELWQRLGLEEFPSDKAEKFVFETGQAGKLLVIRLESVWDYRYLFFKTSGDRWRFMSYHDQFEERYGAPEQQVEFAGNQVWFVIRTLMGRGTGLSFHSNEWLSLTTREAKTVLRVADCCQFQSPLDLVICDQWDVAEKKFINGKYR